ncbi:hypothetical protein [Mesorhizobium dulcispinae]|uniref:hypothetical protein n=1 Tax=Mesorhizobium dulcispinae TaxID=3072316 RepID=UPI002A24C20C|nr:hypothetical protein [Mesorhizobium sp. VK23D]MDX8521471.1 hypothetical protein [Mesorhizobium sp. VK23D]
MKKAPSIKDDRVLPLDVDGQTVWIVRFKNDLFLKKAFDNEAELSEALGADDKAPVGDRVEPPAQGNAWVTLEFDLGGKPVYAVCNSDEAKISEKGTYKRPLAEAWAKSLNRRSDTHRPQSPRI